MVKPPSGHCGFPEAAPSEWYSGDCTYQLDGAEAQPPILFPLVQKLSTG